MNSILIVLITTIPIALWSVYFYSKNPRHQPIGEVVKIFILGMASIIPVFIFHQYFLEPTTQLLLKTFNISHIAVLPGLIHLILTAVFIAFFIFIFAALQCTALRIFYHLPWVENFKTVHKRMYNLTPLLLFFFLFLIAEIALELSIGIDFIFSLAGSTIIFAVLEEYFKYMINPFLAYKKLNSIGSAIINTLYIGLAFAFVENIIFFINTQGSPNFTAIFIYRSVFTTLLHVCASGILGYFYGLSLFSKSILTNYEIEKGQYSKFSPIRKLLNMRKNSIFKNVSITQGFFVAALVHAIFNYLILINLNLLSAVLIVAFSLFIVYLLNMKSVQIQYGLVGSQTMPEEDFEKLRLQISVSQHIKEIREAQNKSTKPETPNSNATPN